VCVLVRTAINKTFVWSALALDSKHMQVRFSIVAVIIVGVVAGNVSNDRSQSFSQLNELLCGKNFSRASN
jgi:hypothetical protein